MSRPIDVDEIYYCWLWDGELNRDGYGVLWNPRRLAHRVVYEEEVGPIMNGLMLDHVCRRRNCVNPMHLEPVKQSANERRKSWAYRVRMKTCRFGHNRYEHGRRTPEGGFICLVCE